MIEILQYTHKKGLGFRALPIIGNIPKLPYFRVLKVMLRIYIINCRETNQGLK